MLSTKQFSIWSDPFSRAELFQTLMKEMTEPTEFDDLDPREFWNVALHENFMLRGRRFYAGICDGTVVAISSLRRLRGCGRCHSASHRLKIAPRHPFCLAGTSSFFTSCDVNALGSSRLWRFSAPRARP
jgi:hypothetical protein